MVPRAMKRCFPYSTSLTWSPALALGAKENPRLYIILTRLKFWRVSKGEPFESFRKGLGNPIERVSQRFCASFLRVPKGGAALKERIAVRKLTVAACLAETCLQSLSPQKTTPDGDPSGVTVTLLFSARASASPATRSARSCRRAALPYRRSPRSANRAAPPPPAPYRHR